MKKLEVEIQTLSELDVVTMLVCLYPARNGAEVSCSEETCPARSHQQLGEGTSSTAP